MTRPPDATLYEESPVRSAGASNAGWTFSRILLRAALLGLALTPLAISLGRHASELRASLQDITWVTVILGLVGFLVLLPLMASLAWVTADDWRRISGGVASSDCTISSRQPSTFRVASGSSPGG